MVFVEDAARNESVAPGASLGHGEGLPVGVLVANVAVTAWGLVNVIVHTPVPVQAPLQPVKVEPVVVTAASVTVVPLWKLTLQVVLQ